MECSIHQVKLTPSYIDVIAQALHGCRLTNLVISHPQVDDDDRTAVMRRWTPTSIPSKLSSSSLKGFRFQREGKAHFAGWTAIQLVLTDSFIHAFSKMCNVCISFTELREIDFPVSEDYGNSVSARIQGAEEVATQRTQRVVQFAELWMQVMLHSMSYPRWSDNCLLMLYKCSTVASSHAAIEIQVMQARSARGERTTQLFIDDVTADRYISFCDAQSRRY